METASGRVPEPVLRADGLRVRYRNGALGILDVSLEVGQGEIAALLGPNGAGKTTTARALSGFVRTEGAAVISGTVRLLGEDITGFEPHRPAARGLRLVPERRKIFPNLTVSENLQALGGTARGRARSAMDRVFALFPDLANRTKELAGRLSGGQQQMLALARCLLSDPKVLLVDEMTLGLHHSLYPVLADAMRVVAQEGTAVVLIDENTAFALEVASYCYLISAGVVTDQGAAVEFTDNTRIAKSYTS